MEICHFTAAEDQTLQSLTRTKKLAAGGRTILLFHTTKSSVLLMRKEMFHKSDEFILNAANLPQY